VIDVFAVIYVFAAILTAILVAAANFRLHANLQIE